MILSFRPCYTVSYLWLCVYTCKAFNTWTGREPRNCFRKPQRFGASPRPIDDLQGSYDVVVVGSGVGGLSAAAMLSLYGYSVCVLESHSAPGGCAHGFSVKDKDLNGTFFFDTGPSFFSGLNPDLPAKASNPLRSVLDAIGERVECHPYTSFGLKFPEGDFVHTPDFANDVLSQASSSGPAAALQWKQLMSDMAPLERVVAALPTTAFRFDLGGLLTVSRFLPKFIAATPNPLENLKLTKPFQSIIDGAGVTDRFTRNWLDLLCFCLSGLPAKGTITAEMALMLGEFYQPNAVMDCPKHGAKAIVDALVRGIEKHGGSIFCNSHVREILIDRGKVTGVQLRNGKSVAARKAVISNLSVWDLFGANGLVDSKHFRPSFVQSRVATPVGKSFVHLHVGFRATRSELQDLQAHYMYIDDWERGVEAANNAVLVSIPSVHDPTLAPDGYAVLHIYTPATEDFAAWEGIARGSPEYTALKEDRSLYLWNVLEKIIPDIRLRAKVSKVG
jgi:phytoene dehydrogenase-like protein